MLNTYLHQFPFDGPRSVFVPALSGIDEPSLHLPQRQRKTIKGYREKFLSLRREAEARAALRLVEDGVDGLEEDVAEDGESQALVGLDASEALGAASGGEVDVAARDDEGLAVDGDVEVGQLGRAREDVAALVAVVRGAGDGRVVVVDDVVGEEHEGGAGVGDGGADGPQGARRGSDAVAAGGELPEAVGAIDGGVGDGAGVL
jgi:hypothetical protein